MNRIYKFAICCLLTISCANAVSFGDLKKLEDKQVTVIIESNITHPTGRPMGLQFEGRLELNSDKKSFSLNDNNLMGVTIRLDANSNITRIHENKMFPVTASVMDDIQSILYWDDRYLSRK